MDRRLTHCQRIALRTIASLLDELDRAPTLRELAAALGVAPSTAYARLQALERHGVIRREPGVASGIHLVPDD